MYVTVGEAGRAVSIAALIAPPAWPMTGEPRVVGLDCEPNVVW
jgi:hypothetical protein